MARCPCFPQRMAVLAVAVLVLSCCTAGVFALKELPVNPVFAQPVQDAVTCDINSAIVLNLNRQVQHLREEMEAKRLRVREDNILGIMENLCNPFKDEGAWIRQVGFHVEHDDKEPSAVAATGPVLSVRVMPHYTVCKRTCATVRTMCEGFLDSSAADDLSALILRALTHFEDLTTDAATRAMLEAVCYSSDYCRLKGEYQDWLRGLAQLEGYTAVTEVEEDVPERISKDDMDMEQMMAGAFADKGQKTSVFARDEVMKLHTAIAQGDRELAESLDPSMKDMSREEFEELQAVFMDESPYASGDASFPLDGSDL